MWWLLGTVLVLLLSVYCFMCNRHRKKYAKFYNLPGPKAYPIIGHGYLFIKRQMFKVFQEIIKQTGLPCLLYLPEPHYCTSDPSEIKILLNHPNVMSKSEIYKFFDVVLGNGLISAPADIWKPKRKLLSKSFNKTLLDSFVPIFYRNSCRLKEGLLNCDSLFVLFECYTLDSFFESTGGIFMNELTEKLVELITRGQEIIIKKATSPLLRYEFIHKRTKEGKFVTAAFADFYEVILHNLKKENVNTQETVDPLDRVPISELLRKLKREGKITDEQMFREISTFAAAATDTTGYTLATLCTLLGMHPHVQEKVFEEVMTVIGPTKEIEYTDLPNLKYTEMVILETLRILPTVPIIGRKTEADIDIGRCVIPSGSNIYIFIFNLHRNEKYYPNPLEFNPGRFLPEEIEKRDPNTYIPFSIGPRNCIGWIYALMLMKTAIANIVRDYKIASKHKSVTEFNLESNLVMKIVPHPDCRFARRYC